MMHHLDLRVSVVQLVSHRDAYVLHVLSHAEVEGNEHVDALVNEGVGKHPRSQGL